jgi:hypothetical protein
MRQRHFAGETMFVDYAGRTVPIYGSGGQVAYQAHHLTSPARYYALVSNTTKIQKNAGRSR